MAQTILREALERTTAGISGAIHVGMEAAGNIGAQNLRDWLAALKGQVDAKLPLAGGRLTGALELGSAGRLLKAVGSAVDLESAEGSAILGAKSNAHMASNAYWDGTNWNRYDTARPAALFYVEADLGRSVVALAPAGPNPIAWTLNPVWHSGNDGAGSGLDADLLDGLDSSAFPRATRQVNTAAPLTGGGDLSADRTLGISAATQGAAGSMSGADKTKLDNIEAGAKAAHANLAGLAADDHPQYLSNARGDARYVPLSQKGAAGGVATLDPNTGQLSSSQVPPVAITNTTVVLSQAAMLALTAEVGDVAVRSDLNRSYVLRAEPASTLANWQELLTPTDQVLSVAGKTGAVTLDHNADLANLAVGDPHTQYALSDGTRMRVYRGTTPPANPQPGQLWADTTTTPATLKNWSGSAWLSPQATPIDGSVTDAKVAAGAAIAKSKLAALSIVDADVATGAAIAESKLALASDGPAGTATRRSLGTGAQQAAPGNDARINGAVQKDGSVGMTGLLGLSGDAENALNPVTLQQWQTDPYKRRMRAATIAALPAYTASNNTLTAQASGAFPTQDGVNLVPGDRLLVKNEPAGSPDLRTNNGLYVLSDPGSASTPWVLTRASDANTTAKVAGGVTVRITEGGQDGQLWYLSTTGTITLGTTALVFSQQAGGSGGSSVVPQDEGTDLIARPRINFVGGGVTASDDAANLRTLVTIPAGYMPDWAAQSGAGSLFAAWGPGDPTRAAMMLDMGTVAGPTPSGVGTTTARLVKFRLPKTLQLAAVRAFSTAAQTSAILRLGIYNASNGALVWDSGLFAGLANAWLSLTGTAGVTLSASQDYWLAFTVSAVGTTASFRTPAAPVSSTLFGAGAGPLGGRSMGLAEFAQVTLATAGTLPSTLPALAAAGFGGGTTGSLPVAFLEGAA